MGASGLQWSVTSLKSSSAPIDIPQSEEDGDEESEDDVSSEEVLPLHADIQFRADKVILNFEYQSPNERSFTDRLFKPPKA